MRGTVTSLVRGREEKREDKKVKVGFWRSLSRAAGVFGWEGLLFSMFSFFFARSLVFGELMFFGPAYMAAVYGLFPERRWQVFLFSLAGVVTLGSGLNVWQEIAVYFVLFLCLKLFYLNLKQRRTGISLLFLACNTVVKSFFLLLLAEPPGQYVIVLLEGVLGALVVYVFMQGMLGWKAGWNRIVQREEVFCYLLMPLGLLLGLQGFTFGEVDFYSVAGKLLVLLALAAGGGGTGVVAGVLVGLVPALSAKGASDFIGQYALLALIASAFRGMGKGFLIIGYFLAAVFTSLYFYEQNRLWQELVTTLLAGVGFALLPHPVLVPVKSWLQALGGQRGSELGNRKVKESIAYRIGDLARVFRELAGVLAQVTCSHEEQEKELAGLFHAVAERVCGGCALYRTCWEKEFYRTYRRLLDLLAIAEHRGKVEEQMVPLDLEKRCRRLREMLAVLNCLGDYQRALRQWQRKLEDSRQVLAFQLEGAAAIMEGLVRSLRTDMVVQEDTGYLLRKELARQGMGVRDLRVLAAADGYTEICINRTSCGGRGECRQLVAPAVSKLLGRPVAVVNQHYCTRRTGETFCEFRLSPAPRYRVRWAGAKRARDGNVLSGDSYTALELRDGTFVAILSDGMGNGPRAARESHYTVTLLEKLLETGFDRVSAIKIVNAVMALRAGEETFATLDMVAVDLCTGRADFYKIGSAPGYLKRGKQVWEIRSSSLPVGVLHAIEVESQQRQLEEGDVIVLVTDGVVDAGRAEEKSGWLPVFLRSLPWDDPEVIVEEIVEKAAVLGGEEGDDMAAVVVVLERQQ